MFPLPDFSEKCQGLRPLSQHALQDGSLEIALRQGEEVAGGVTFELCPKRPVVAFWLFLLLGWWLGGG